jgi:excisionase family DNA binding protein
MNATERDAYSVDDARFRLGGASRDTIERLIKRGELRSFTVGRRRFVSSAELARFIASREQAAN